MKEREKFFDVLNRLIGVKPKSQKDSRDDYIGKKSNQDRTEDASDLQNGKSREENA